MDDPASWPDAVWALEHFIAFLEAQPWDRLDAWAAVHQSPCTPEEEDAAPAEAGSCGFLRVLLKTESGVGRLMDWTETITMLGSEEELESFVRERERGRRARNQIQPKSRELRDQRLLRFQHHSTDQGHEQEGQRQEEQGATAGGAKHRSRSPVQATRQEQEGARSRSRSKTSRSRS
jgi:hypothetical protein